MSIIDDVLFLHSRPDGAAVSRTELEGLRRQQRIAELIAHLKSPNERDSMQLEEQQREGRMRHIEWRLEHASGRAAADFALGAMRSRAEDDGDRSR